MDTDEERVVLRKLLSTNNVAQLLWCKKPLPGGVRLITLQAYIREWRLTRQQTTAFLKDTHTDAHMDTHTLLHLWFAAWDMKTFHYQQEVTSLLIVLPTHCDLILVCPWVIRADVKLNNLISLLLQFFYMRFWSPMMPSVGSSLFCCLHALVFK